MAAYQAKDSLTLSRQLKVITLAIPFKIVGSATSSSVVVTTDEPGLLFLNTAGVTNITSSTGALDAGEATPTYVAPNDATPVASALVRVNETVGQVVGAFVVTNAGTTAVVGACPVANTTGISANKNKICLNLYCQTAYNTSATLNQTLYVSYIPAIG